MADTVVRGGTIVVPAGVRQSDLAIEDGRVSEIGVDLPGARDEIDARGLLVLPAMIDVHVHFNEPGRTHWEGAATGSRALAAGGGTVFFDMPLNSTPCSVNAREIDSKRAALEAASIVDFGLWGGLVPGAVGEMAGMADRGVVGFKAFMCDSGLPEFPRADDDTLYEGMREAARLGLPVAVHAENEEITRALSQRMSGRTPRDFLDSRPVVAELEAIQRALLFAGTTHAKLHIVHVSTGRGVMLAREARSRGVDVSVETCPHYLAFDESDVERLGAIAKCAPPLRNREHVDALWDHLLNQRLDIVASDHSPTEPERKAGDFIGAWGGIAGIQMTLPVLIDRGYHDRQVPLEQLIELVAAAPARRFGIARKGALVVGHDADLVLIDPTQSFTLRSDDLRQRHKISPYIGETFRGVVRKTVRRGETVFADGQITARSGGRFIRPEPCRIDSD